MILVNLLHRLITLLFIHLRSELIQRQLLFVANRRQVAVGKDFDFQSALQMQKLP
jgi:hypothetical protein